MRTKKAKCSYCSQNIAFTAGSLGNLGRHLKRKHPIIFTNITECQPPIQSQAISITSTDETKTETITANENQQIATKSELRPQTIIVQQKIDAFAESIKPLPSRKKN